MEVKKTVVEGQPGYVINLSPEQKELLRSLYLSSGWAICRKILEAQRDAILNSMMISTDYNETKYGTHIGRAAGINLALSSLDSIFVQLEQARRVTEESINQSARNGQSGKE